MRLSRVVLFSSVVLTTAVYLQAGEFGSTEQLFSQFGIGGIAESHFTVRSTGEAAITVDIELRLSDGSIFLEDSVEVPAGTTVTVIYSDPEGEVKSGWARLSSSGQFTASLFYRIEGVGNVGVLPSTPAKHLQLFSFVEGTDTGLAWANPDPANPSALMVRVLNGEGQLQREVETTLDALGHDAFFLTEDPYLADSNGAVEIWADRPIIAVSLRTDDSLLAGVPVIGAQGDGLEPGSITTEHLADGAVTGPKIADGAVVRSLNGLADAVTLAAGDNVTITPTGQTLTIAADGLEGPQGDPGPQGPQGPPGQDGQDFALPFSGTVSTGETTPALLVRNNGTSNAGLFVSGGSSSTLEVVGIGPANALLAIGSSATQPAFDARNFAGGDAAHFSGRVGIGTISPATDLHVHGGTGSSHAATIQNPVAGSNSDVLDLRVGATTPGSGNNYLTFRSGLLGGLGVAGQIDGNGAGGVNYKSTGSDFAEWLPRLDGEERIEAGDIVGVFEGRISRKTAGANQIMVISTAPIVLGNSPPESEEHLYEKVAFVGQAPVRVLGPVKAGDYIIASGLHDGTSVAVSREEMAASQHSLAVGQSWESSSQPGVKLINIAVGLLHSSGSEQVLQLTRELEQLKATHEALRVGVKDADYVFDDYYQLESIEEHSKSMWKEKHLPAVGAGEKDDRGREYVEYDSRMRGILEELEKAHIYIELLHNQNKTLEVQLRDVQQVVAELVEKAGH